MLSSKTWNLLGSISGLVLSIALIAFLSLGLISSVDKKVNLNLNNNESVRLTP